MQHNLHPALAKNGWYAVLAARLDVEADVWHDFELLYVGDAFETPLRQSIGGEGADLVAIRQAVPAGKEAIVMLGTATNRSRKKRDTRYLQGVLRALVVRNRPRLAPSYAEPYDGETVSVVLEGDHKPLKVKVLLRPDTTTNDVGPPVPTQTSRSGTIRRRATAPKAETTPVTYSAGPQPARGTAMPLDQKAITTPTNRRRRNTSARFQIAGPGTTSVTRDA